MKFSADEQALYDSGKIFGRRKFNYTEARPLSDDIRELHDNASHIMAIGNGSRDRLIHLLGLYEGGAEVMTNGALKDEFLKTAADIRANLEQTGEVASEPSVLLQQSAVAVPVVQQIQPASIIAGSVASTSVPDSSIVPNPSLTLEKKSVSPAKVAVPVWNRPSTSLKPDIKVIARKRREFDAIHTGGLWHSMMNTLAGPYKAPPATVSPVHLSNPPATAPAKKELPKVESEQVKLEVKKDSDPKGAKTKQAA